MFATYVLGLAGNALLLVIVVRGLSAHLLPRYRAFYFYVSFVAVTSLGQMAIWAILGFRSPAYYWSWHLPNLLSPFLLLVVLVDIWKRVEPVIESRKRVLLVPAIVVASFVVIVAARLFNTDGNPFIRFQAAALFSQMLVSIFVYVRVSGRREVYLGKNLKGILLGVSVLVGLQGMNFAHLLFMGTPTDVFRFFLQFFYFLALAVFTYSLWSYEPVTVLSMDYRNRLGKVSEDLEKAVRMLASSR